MYVVISPIQIIEGHKEELVNELLEEAKVVATDEPGCLRFEVIQDAGDSNRIWIYEVFTDEAAFQAHAKAPHVTKFLEAAKAWTDEPVLKGPALGSYNIWPADPDWK